MISRRYLERRRQRAAAPDEELQAFRQHLTRSLHLLRHTAQAYARAVRQYLYHVNPATAVNALSHEASQLLPRRALKAWAEWKGDASLGAQLQALPRLRHAKDTLRAHVPFDEDDYEQMLRLLPRVARGPAERFALVLMFQSGARCNDITHGVRRDELASAIGGRYLRIYTKGTKVRDVQITQEMRRYGHALLGFERWERLWEVYHLDDTAKPWARKLALDSASAYLRAAIVNTGKAAGVKSRVHPHRVRRTVAVRFYRRKPDVEALMRFMGWSSPETALRYIRGYGLDDLAADIDAITPRIPG